MPVMLYANINKVEGSAPAELRDANCELMSEFTN